MSASSRSKVVLPLVSLLAVTALAFSAEAQQAQQPSGQAPPANSPQHPHPTGRSPAAAVRAVPHPGGAVAHAVPGGPGPHMAPRRPHVVRAGQIPSRSFGGHAYRGHLAWEGGRWHHEMHDGRMGWWWDVGGVWYFYPQRMEGPPDYISDDYADDVAYGYVPADAAYAPPPPPPPPDPGASAVGGAIVGGLLGGLLTGQASGAAAGAVIGGATGAIAGATAASRPGYWMAEGNCYYRYPDGQYVQADPRWCY